MMETATASLVTSDSDLHNITEELRTTASNASENYTDDYEPSILGGTVYISIISSLEIPIICLAIGAVCSLIRSKQTAPVFVMNLLISDLIQIVCTTFLIIPYRMSYAILLIGLFWTGYTGVYFMTCIAVERYILIAHPVWHRSHCSVGCLVCTSLTCWLISLISFPVVFTGVGLIFWLSFVLFAVIIVCFVGACMCLSRSISLTPLKKLIVLGPLFFVAISSTFLILPIHISLGMHVYFNIFIHRHLVGFLFNLYMLKPLVDCFLYVFMRSDAENIIKKALCCCRLNGDQTETEQTTSTDEQLHHV